MEEIGNQKEKTLKAMRLVKDRNAMTAWLNKQAKSRYDIQWINDDTRRRKERLKKKKKKERTVRRISNFMDFFTFSTSFCISSYPCLSLVTL